MQARPQVQKPNQEYIGSDFFTYSATFNTVTNGTSQTSNIQIQADSDFEIQKLTAELIVSLGTDAAPLDFPVTVLLTDTGTGRQLMNQAVPIQSLFGTGALPFILPNTKILAANAVLAVQVNNLSTAVPYDRIQLSFIGRKLFRGSLNR
jgi:hypothetical protein